MAQGTLKIHSENILPIIKKWLYSDRDIFTRELISNANDAIHKLKILRDQGKAEVSDEEFRIDIRIDKENKTLSFSDTGLGMDAEEVEKYIAQIAFSGAEDFVEKYATSEQFIGHFGLGFYSSYMVADTVEIQTLSYKEGAKPVHWLCDGSPNYTLEEGTRKSRGTEIILHISKENEEYLDAVALRKILISYCEFLPNPIYLNGERLNEKEPLWLKSPSELKDEDYLNFYRHLYPMSADPLFWIHLSVDYPFTLKGILYFPRIDRNRDFSKGSIKLFCNRVFVSDNCKEIIPEFLLPLSGALDAPDLPLNVSRSALQMDRTVRQLSGHISKKVADTLVQLYQQEKEKFLANWNDISMVVKIGCLENEKFYERVKECLIFKNSKGEWMTLDEYRTLYGDTILYAADPEHHSPLVKLYTDKGKEVLFAAHPVDPYLIHHLEMKLSPVKFKRIDSELDDSIADSEASDLAERFKEALGESQIIVQARKLSASGVPGIVTLDENQRRLREAMRMIDPSHALQGMDSYTFVINAESPLVQSICSLKEREPELARELAREVYELALLSQKEMSPDLFNEHIRRTQALLTTLTSKLTK
ncbi:MAG: molecular chaperone HtpG [Chlamydiia bacterium]|nr:molecular chaperone HtpG [Chlamydiia bacterium]